jgi:hypothetical protein
LRSQTPTPGGGVQVWYQLPIPAVTQLQLFPTVTHLTQASALWAENAIPRMGASDNEIVIAKPFTNFNTSSSLRFGLLL